MQGNQFYQLDVVSSGANPAKLPEVQLKHVPQKNRFVRRSDYLTAMMERGDSAAPDPADADPTDAAAAAAAAVAAATTAAVYVPAVAPDGTPIMPVPIKVMMFLDGTWLYYTIYGRERARCPIVRRFGDRWTATHRVDWARMHAHVRGCVARHLPGRLVDVTRVVVFGSVRQARSRGARSVRAAPFAGPAEGGKEVERGGAVGFGSIAGGRAW
jgi:hypothetical protein